MVDSSAVENVLEPVGRLAAPRSEKRTPDGLSKGLLGCGAARSENRMPPAGSSSGLDGLDRIGSAVGGGGGINVVGGGANEGTYVCLPVCEGEGGV